MTPPTLQDHEARIAELEADSVNHLARTAELERLVQGFLGAQLQTLQSTSASFLDQAKQVVQAQASVMTARGQLDDLTTRVGKLETK